jgi:hypothetical protein
MIRLVLAAILIVTTTLMGGNVAAAASNASAPQSLAETASVSVPDSDFSQFRDTDNSSHADRPLPFYVAQVSNVCQTR